MSTPSPNGGASNTPPGTSGSSDVLDMPTGCDVPDLKTAVTIGIPLAPNSALPAGTFGVCRNLECHTGLALEQTQTFDRPDGEAGGLTIFVAINSGLLSVDLSGEFEGLPGDSYRFTFRRESGSDTRILFAGPVSYASSGGWPTDGSCVRLTTGSAYTTEPVDLSDADAGTP